MVNQQPEKKQIGEPDEKESKRFCLPDGEPQEGQLLDGEKLPAEESETLAHQPIFGASFNPITFDHLAKQRESNGASFLDKEENKEPAKDDLEDEKPADEGLKEAAVITGEEQEEVVYSCQAKVYKFDRTGNSWKEKGSGLLKLNSCQKEPSTSYRLLLRHEVLKTVLLNVLVSESLRPTPTQERCLQLIAGVEEEKPALVLVKTKTVEECKALLREIKEATARK